MDSKALIKVLTEDGWYFTDCKGDHHHYKHPTKPGKLTITHPVRDIPKGTLNAILKQAGLK